MRIKVEDEKDIVGTLIVDNLFKCILVKVE